jgi:hypothetical protein
LAAAVEVDLVMVAVHQSGKLRVADVLQFAYKVEPMI